MIQKSILEIKNPPGGGLLNLSSTLKRRRTHLPKSRANQADLPEFNSLYRHSAKGYALWTLCQGCRIDMPATGP
jgi:hypothetical protein